MIEIRIKLRSAHGKDKDRMLGVITIANDGTGTASLGNYQYALSHSGDYFGKGKKEPYKAGRIVGHNRRASVYRLVARILKDAGELS